MSIKITGLDKIQRELEELQRVLKALDGPITKVSINPNDPESVDRAIRDMEEAVDRKTAPYGHNPMVKQIVEKSKAAFRERIRQRAKEKA